MSDAWRKLIVVSLACYLITLAVVLLMAILSFSNMDALPEFQREWIAMRTIADFLAVAPVAQAWAVALTYSLVVPMGSLISSQAMSGTAGGVTPPLHVQPEHVCPTGQPCRGHIAGSTVSSHCSPGFMAVSPHQLCVEHVQSLLQYRCGGQP